MHKEALGNAFLKTTSDSTTAVQAEQAVIKVLGAFSCTVAHSVAAHIHGCPFGQVWHCHA